jgi:hypothetical protein
MIHYTCDMCGKALDPESSDRYRVLIDVEKMPPGTTDDDLDSDFDEEFEQFSLDPGREEDEEEYLKSYKFDLCPECAEIYVRDPLARKLPRRLRHLDN